jgi:hypothetical protein
VSKAKKRTRVTAKKEAASSITIRQITRTKGDTTWTTYLVQGWKENGKWQRKQFKKRADAEREAALKRVELENKGRKQHMVLSPLTEKQHEEARQAFDRLGDTYSMTEAVEFFLRHHRAPDYAISVRDAAKLFVDEKERDGLRPRTIAGLEWTLKLFRKASRNPKVHEVTPQDVERFLSGLRAKDGKSKASRRTWEIHRSALNGFFTWAAEKDVATNRPFTFENPVASVRKFSSRQVREEQSKKGKKTTKVEDVERIFATLRRWRGGKLLRAYAYLYLAGLRPESELLELSDREDELVNLDTRTITIPAHIAKTKHDRQIRISENLAAWLEVAPKPIIPKNYENLNKKVRKHFKLGRDETRHSFISYHVALHRSIGDAALQAGNSESVVRQHYLNLHPREEGEAFFSIFPAGHEQAVGTPHQAGAVTPEHLRVVGSR